MYSENGTPGKFEGNASTLPAQVLYDVLGDGMETEAFGTVNLGGYHALIEGKRYSFIVIEDSQGFFTVLDVGLPDEILALWESLNEAYWEMFEFDFAA